MANTTKSKTPSSGLSKPFEPVPPKPSLLIVDDEEILRDSLNMVFRDRFRVFLAESGMKALKLASEDHLDVAIVDIRMPGMSGIEVLEALKKIDPSIEVIMLTAYQTLDTARQAIRLGAFDYQSKPFAVTTMRECVDDAMARRAANERLLQQSQELVTLREEVHDKQVQEKIARTQSEIYASVIHDINSPLTVISGYLDIINGSLQTSRQLEGTALDETKHHLAQVTRQVDICIRIIHRYLGFFRQQQGQNLRIDVRQVLEDLKELLLIHPQAKEHTLNVAPPEEECWVRMNGTDLIQTLLNLALNALQATSDPHEVSIAAKRIANPDSSRESKRSPGIRSVAAPGFNPSAPVVELSIEDNGPGIAPENMKRLFETHFTTKPEGQGTGLGLAIVHRFVMDAGGAIQVKSRPGEGTRFSLRLPCWAKSQPA